MKIIAFATLLLALAATCVSAATVVQTASMPASTTNAYTTLSVAKFDPSLGTLNSVKFDLSSTFTSTLSWTNTGSGAGYITWGVVDPTIQLNAPDSSALIGSQCLGWIIFAGTQTAPVSPATSGIKVLAGANYSDTKSVSGACSQIITDGLSAYVGSGSVALPFSAEVPSFALSTTGGNGIRTLATHATADLTVTYDYTPVPEPSSILALVAGLGSLAAFRRRRA